MMANDTSTAKWSDKKMEGDEGLRTVECLRGRLLAERAASKAANDESEQIGEKVIELEKQLKMEIKSRNKAEKRLKFLIKKLDSLNISYVSTDESSSFSEKSKVSSVSSSSKYQDQMELQKIQFRDASECEMDTTTSGERHDCPSQEENSGSLDVAISGISNENLIRYNQKDDDQDDLNKDNNNGSKSLVTKHNIDNEGNDEGNDDSVDNSMALVVVENKAISIRGHDEDGDGGFDNSMALVMVDSMVKEEKQDVNVKDVLDALRYARESLRSSMEITRHMRSNLSQGRLKGISC